MPKHTMWVLFYSLLFLIGAGLSNLAYKQYMQSQKLMSNGVKTNATVIDLLTSNSDGTVMYTPVFEFTDRRQNKHVYQSKVQSHPAPYDIGEKVKIVYNSKKPTRVKTISFWGLYSSSVILFMVAAPFLILGASYLIYSLK